MCLKLREKGSGAGGERERKSFLREKENNELNERNAR